MLKADAYRSNDIDVSEYMRRARELTGLTQRQFVERYNNMAPLSLKLTRNAYSKYENGRIIPPADKFLKTMLVLNRYGFTFSAAQGS